MAQLTGAPPQRIDFAKTLDARTKTFTVIGALLGLFLAALDQTIVATALRSITRDLQGINLYTWVTTSYLLASTAMVPVYGKLSDIYGRKKILLFGIALFLGASMLCGAAPSMVTLILFRGLQGLGAAALTSTAFSVVADLFEMRSRARVQGAFGAVFGLSSIVGPLIGGFLTDHLSWRWVFYVNLPIGFVAVLFILARMPPLKADEHAKVDFLGSFLLVAGAVPLFLSLSLRKFSPLTGALLAAGVAGFVLFFFVERKAKSPLLPLLMLRNRTFSLGILVSFFFGVAFFGAILFIPLFMQEVVGISATASGVTLMPLTISIVLASAVSGQIAARTGATKPLIVGGLMIVIAGYFLLYGLGTDATQVSVSWRMLILGIGFGPCLPLLNLTVQNSVPRHEIGIATSTRQFAQQFGSVFGSAILGAVFAISLNGERHDLAEALASTVPAALRDPVREAVGARAAGERREGGSDDRMAQTAHLKEKLKSEINVEFDGWSSEFDRALAQGDGGARSRLLLNPDVPSPLKDLLNRPGNSAADARVELDQGRQLALHEADRLPELLNTYRREAFTVAITRVYLAAMEAAIIALLVAIWLRNTKMPGPAAPQPVRPEAHEH